MQKGRRIYEGREELVMASGQTGRYAEMFLGGVESEHPSGDAEVLINSIILSRLATLSN